MPMLNLAQLVGDVRKNVGYYVYSGYEIPRILTEMFRESLNMLRRDSQAQVPRYIENHQLVQAVSEAVDVDMGKMVGWEHIHGRYRGVKIEVSEEIAEAVRRSFEHRMKDFVRQLD